MRRPNSDTGKTKKRVEHKKEMVSLSDEHESSSDETLLPKTPEGQKKNDLKKDYKNIALLMLLYFLQGLPLGLNSSLPYILSAKKVSYADQGTFSFAFWPFSLKLLWAPLVDAIYVKKFGRRKSWLVPIQYLIGIFMFTFSDYVHNLLESNKNATTQTPYGIYILTGVFFMFTFLAATQDIVVDAWALTMLSKENVGWASTCNSVGQTAGWFVGNVVFLTLESDDFSNKYIRHFFGYANQDYGILTLDTFMHILGFTFIITTTLVMIFKKETVNNEPEDSKDEEKNKHQKNFEDHLTIKSTYLLMWKLLHIAPVKKICIILLTMKIAFATESMTVIKLIEYGVPREKLGLLAVPLMPLQIILPLVISRYTNGPEPLTLFFKAIPGRITMGVVSAVWVYITPYFKDSNNEYPFHYYLFCILINAAHSVFVYTIFVAQVSFFAKVSDKKIGGTYMTFLNTISNLGSNWPSTSAFFLASYMTIKKCLYNAQELVIPKEASVKSILEKLDGNVCGSDSQSKECTDLGGTCVTTVDAYFVLTIFCTIIGFMWVLWKKHTVLSLQHLARSCWKIPESVVRSIVSA